MSKSSWVYISTGVERPIVTVSELRNRATMMRSADSFAQTISSILGQGIKELTDNNAGTALDTAHAALTGTTSARDAHDQLATACSQFSVGLDDSADIVETCLVDMDAQAKTSEDYVTWMSTNANPRSRPMLFQAEVLAARRALNDIANAAATEITEALTIVVPRLPDTPNSADLLPDGLVPDYGYADPQVADLWSQLDPAEQEAVLAAFIRDRLIASGVDPADITVTFRSFAGTADENMAGYYQKSIELGFFTFRGESIHINTENLSDPSIFNTAAHEIQHAVQEAAQAHLDTLSDQTVMDIRAGDIPDPFLSYGLTVDEVWSMARNPYVSVDSAQHPRYPYYLAQPDETDARQAGRDFGSGMSYAQFLDYLAQAGISVP